MEELDVEKGVVLPSVDRVVAGLHSVFDEEEEEVGVPSTLKGKRSPVREGNKGKKGKKGGKKGEGKKGGKKEKKARKQYVEAEQGILFVTEPSTPLPTGGVVGAGEFDVTASSTTASEEFAAPEDVHLSSFPRKSDAEGAPPSSVNQPLLGTPIVGAGTRDGGPASRKKKGNNAAATPIDWKTNPPLIRANAKFDPKVFWGNERTLLSWLGLATFQSMSAVQLLSYEELVPQIAGAVMAFVSIFVAIYALLRWHTRNLALRRGGKMVIVVDMIGPWIFIPIVCIMLISLTTFTFLYGLKKNG